MYRADYHIHSSFSEDSIEPVDNICKKAISLGLNEIAITDHLEFCKNRAYNAEIDLHNLFLEIEEYKQKYKDKLVIKQGLEIGQPYLNLQEYNEYAKLYSPDFIIGSVHTNRDEINYGAFNFSQVDCYELYREYLKDLLLYATYYDFDTLGHLTYPLRYMFMRNKITIDLDLFEKEFINLFEVLRERKKGIEVNTSGYRLFQQPLPNYKILELYKKCGCDILTTGSDSHSAEFLGYEFEDTYKRLVEL
ncbi:MAG: histidinol-phosphatase HisJ family protein, partial [bacterium]